MMTPLKLPDRWLPGIWNISDEQAKRTFVISDLHLGHANIIRYAERPFESVGEMNRTIVDNWNRTIGPDDLVFFLGDMRFGKGSKPAWWWLRKLNGRIVFIRGHHDRGVWPTTKGLNVVGVTDGVVARVGGKLLALTHRSDATPEGFEGWTVHGHIHQKQPHISGKVKRVNVSVEVVDYTPVSLADIVGKIKREEGLVPTRSLPVAKKRIRRKVARRTSVALAGARR